MNIRQAQSGDIPALLDLFFAVAAERTWLGTEPETFDRERRNAGYERAIADVNRCVLVAERDGALLGSLYLAPADTTGHELGMFVAGGHRGGGIGRALMGAGIAWARERNSPRLELGVFPHNEAALGLYTSFGFTLVETLTSESTRASGETWDVIILEKVL